MLSPQACTGEPRLLTTVASFPRKLSGSAVPSFLSPILLFLYVFPLPLSPSSLSLTLYLSLPSLSVPPQYSGRRLVRRGVQAQAEGGHWLDTDWTLGGHRLKVDTGWTQAGHRVDTAGHQVDTGWRQAGHQVDTDWTQAGLRLEAPPSSGCWLVSLLSRTGTGGLVLG